MVVEAPISPDTIASVARFGMRVMPKWLRKRRLFSNAGLWAYAKVLRQHFDNTDPKYDNHVHLVAIEGSASVLERLDIPHPDKSEGRSVWRAFLSYIVIAADDADINKAREVMSNKAVFLRAAEEEDIRLNPGKGDLVMPFIMKRAFTEKKVQSIYDDFRKADRKTYEIEAFAAYAKKMTRLLDVPERDDEEYQDWLREKFDPEVVRLDSAEHITLVMRNLEHEFPDEE